MHTQNEIEALIELLCSPNNKTAYSALKALKAVSEQSDAAMPHIDSFIKMMRNPNSYIRTRGLTLIACNAKWDEKGKVDAVIDEYLEHVTDEKPITARQCVKSLMQLAEAKPQLVPRIVAALRNADASRCPDSMRPLVQGDIRDALLALDALR